MMKKIVEADSKGKWLVALCIVALALAIILPIRAMSVQGGAGRYIDQNATMPSVSAQGGNDATQQAVPPADVNAGQYIGEEAAKTIALEHAGTTPEQVTFYRAHLDRDDRRDVYDVEFYSGYTEYDYEIDAINGNILEYDMDIEHYSGRSNPSAGSGNSGNGATEQMPAPVPQQPQAQPPQPPQPQDAAVSYIGEDAAKSIALEHAGLTVAQASFLRAHLDRDDRRDVYDVEFYSGYTEYDYEIDAVDGTILEYDMDYDD